MSGISSVQAVEKDSYASLRFDRLAPTYCREYASARRFLARLASEIFLISLQTEFFKALPNQLPQLEVSLGKNFNPALADTVDSPGDCARQGPVLDKPL
jgi:hypothetical protein